MEIMLLGLAIGVAAFCILFILVAVCLCIFSGNDSYDVYWNEAFGWFCVFAGAGASIGYIVGVFV